MTKRPGTSTITMASTLAVALTLSACGGGADDAEGSPDGAMAGDDIELLMEPGKWSNTMVVESFEIPGMSEQDASIFKSMVGQTNTSESCMTQEQLDEGLEASALESMGGQSCDTSSFNTARGKIDGRIECTSENGGNAVMTIAGTQSSDAMEMTMSTDVTDPSFPGGSAKMVMKLSGKRIGECDA